MQRKGWSRRSSRSLFPFGLVLLLAGLLLLGAERAGAQDPVVYVLPTRGVVNQAMAGYLARGIEAAEEAGAVALVVELNTPGGGLDTTREIVERFNAARVPIVVYVAPSGARAGSAGTFLTYAAHVAAMAPATNIGAAHPVSAGGGEIDKTLGEKITNDAVKLIQGQARLHGRNPGWAEQAVRESASITAEEALEQNVVDLVARDRADLLRQLDGRTVRLPTGEVRLSTLGARVEVLEKQAQEELLDLIGNPNIALLLMVIGFNAILYELAHPGAIFPGVLGAICLLLGLYGVGTLSPNWAGLLFIALAFLLFILEIKVQSPGVLAIGGIIAMLIGGAMLTSGNAPWARISPLTLVLTTAASSALFLVIIGAAWRAQRRPVYVGAEAMLGQRATTRTELKPEGMVFFEGAYWEATSLDGPIGPNEPVLVAGREGLKLYVRRPA